MGIVLHSNTLSKNKIALLDKKLGRVDCIILCQSLCIGSIITYSIKQQKTYYFINDKKVIYIPLALARIDVLFLHHIFELIYYFAPIGSCVMGVFDLLTFLYTVEFRWKDIQFKKFFVFKLLTTMGIVPELYQVNTSCINQLNNIAVNQFECVEMNNTIERELDRWLRYCIFQHPYISDFKTVHFLSENRVV